MQTYSFQGSGWWKYQFCYGINVDQYHVEKDGTKTVIHLGKFHKAKHLEWLERNPHKRPKPMALRKQITHFYSGGTPCDKTGRPRQTEVVYDCAQ
jgi:endoplasmic reticulum lectin 1